MLGHIVDSLYVDVDVQSKGLKIMRIPHRLGKEVLCVIYIVLLEIIGIAIDFCDQFFCSQK